MTDQRNLDPMEQSLLDLRDAEAAGVFRESRVNESILRPRRGSRSFRWQVWKYPVAAAVAASFTVGAFLFRSELRQIREYNGRIASTAFFISCFNGSSEVNPADCRVHDRDRDGFNLEDFSRFQLAFKPPAVLD